MGRLPFLNQLQWVDNEARQDAYVIGYTLFTAGGGNAWTATIWRHSCPGWPTM